ncbi:ABC transporter substrate-binding protein [Bradyrhizobium sp. LHD-71]|uniref:ABC transporter substrate-binding protein n=1 Tax=Bradyrhizobium sp. LHD-71 TaxID=3072141 RepID=UPI00280C6305|nr:ABC transporter substrate-binding protein [Bradyrhizobium sp. LHD-71]MDQ8731613.1 ABC transporter substrate-binding protein [Bradyrhizobium sp. LHD-71]
MRRVNFAAAIALAFALVAQAGPASAQKSSDTLRIVFRDAVPNVDPYYNSQRTGLILAHTAWDTLVYRDPETFDLKPLLATEWKLVDDTTLDFTLRQGVKFHDGSPFSADDVVYTINLVSSPDSKVSTPSNYNWIEKAEKTGDYSVRVKLKRPTPAALEFFALVVHIYPKAYREKVGPEGYAKAPVGAGPYKITKLESSASVEFERFDGYYDSPKGKPAIKKLVVRFVTDAATELTELLSQRADWIWNLNPDQFDNVNKVPFLQAVRQESMRIGYLSMDAAGRTGPENPLTNLKVRQAIWHAIDRQAIADKLVTGGSRVPLAPCFPTQFGCDGEAAVKYDYNPAKAKALLAEAGFPNGFEVELVTYVLPQWAASAQSYLQAVGIKAKISQLQVAAAIQRAQKGENPLYFASWGSYSVNDVSAILPNYFAGGNEDYSRDPELIKLVQEGGSTNDPAARKKAYAKAIKRVTEQAYWMPMPTYVTTYGFSKTLSFKPYPDELPRFFLAKWN